MGTTYSNIQVHSDSTEAVVAALTGLLKEPAYVAPDVNGWVGVYPEGYSDASEKLAKKLSAKLSCSVFFWGVHDSDIFFYTLYEDGKERDEFNSNPDFGTNPNDEDALPPNSPKRQRLRGKPEALVVYCRPGIGYSAVQEVLQPSLSTAPDEDLPAAPDVPEKSLLMLSLMLKTTPDAMRQKFKQLARRKYQFADEQAHDLAKLLGIDENLEACEYRDIAEADGYFVDRQFRLVGSENLSQAYFDQKLWDREVMRYPEKMQEWLQKGANPNVRNQYGRTILFRWAESCSPEQVAILLKAGADVNAGTDGQGRWERGVTALMVAAGRSFEQPNRVTDTVKLLLEAGADVNARSENGRTALSEALVMTDGAEHQGKIGRRAPEEVVRQAAERSAEVVKILRAAGALE